MNSNTIFNAALGMVALLATPSALWAQIQISCNTPIEIDENFTSPSNVEYTKTTSGPCFLVTAANVTLNLSNTTITCNRTSPALCENAISVQATGVTVKNGSIKSGTGAWGRGVHCVSFSGVFFCKVQDLYIEDAWVSAIDGAEQVDTSVIVNSERCIRSLGQLGTSGRYFQNFCDADSVGIEAIGPSSGAFDIERNYVRAFGESGTGILLDSGNFDLTKNIIDADEYIDDSGAGTVTLSKNICGDVTRCPLPGGKPFSLSFDFPE